MIVSVNVSHFVKIYQVLSYDFTLNLSVGVSLILGHVVFMPLKLLCLSYISQVSTFTVALSDSLSA